MARSGTRLYGRGLQQQGNQLMSPVARALGWGVLVIGALTIINPAAADDGTDQVRTKQDVETIVREYLLREPDVIYEALQVLQQQRAVAAAEQQRAAIAANDEELFQDPNTPALGAEEPEVVLVEFFDYHCTYCRRVVASVRALLEDEPGLQIVFKELPVLGPESVLAARAALASDIQGGYRNFHFALMEAEDLSRESILRIAREVGLDVDRLQADMDSKGIGELIDRNYRLASQLGIEGTPAFVIGDELIPGAVDQTRLRELIEQARPS
jgi:protein-disulfide isomerase